MSDDSQINIRVNTSQTGPGLQPTIKDIRTATEATEELNKATKELAETQKEAFKAPESLGTKTLSGSSGLASSGPVPESKADLKRRRELADRVADSRRADEEAAAEEAKEAAEKSAEDGRKAKEKAEKRASDEANRARIAADRYRKQLAADAERDAEQKRKGNILGAKSESKAGQSQLAKELAGNVAGESGEGGSSLGSGLSRVIREAARAVPGFGRLGSVVAALAGPFAIAAGAAAGFFGAIRIGIDSMRAFTAQQEKVRALNIALAASGHVSDALSESVQQLASERQKNTGIDDGKWLSAYSELLRSGATASQLGDFSGKLSSLTAITGSFDSATKLLTGALRGEFSGFQEIGIFIPKHGEQVEKLSLLYRQLAGSAGILEASLDKTAKSTNEVDYAARAAEQGLGGFLKQYYSSAINLGASLFNKAARTFKALHAEQNNLATSGQRLTPIILNQEEATRLLNIQLEGQAKHMKAVAEFTERMISADKRLADSKKNAIDRQRDFNLALIDAAEDKGKRNEKGGISAVEAARQRLIVTRQADVAKTNVETAEKDREISAKAKEAKFIEQHGGSVQEASWNLERSKFLFEEEKKNKNVDPQKLADLESNIRGNETQLGTAQEKNATVRGLRDEIRKLQDEKREILLGASGNIAVGDVRARNEIANLHQEEIARQREAVQHGQPVPKLTPLRPQDTAIDSDLAHSMRDAGNLINPATPAPVRQQSRPVHYGPDPDTAHVQPGQFGKTADFKDNNAAIDTLRQRAAQVFYKKDQQIIGLIEELIAGASKSSEMLNGHERAIRQLESQTRHSRSQM